MGKSILYELSGRFPSNSMNDVTEEERTMRSIVLGSLFSFCLLSCSDESSSKCTEGQTSPCACSNGASGAQLCTAAGSYGDCVCDAPALDSGTTIPNADSSVDQGRDGQVVLGKRIFLTSATFDGLITPDFISTDPLPLADGFCQTAADGQSLGGVWKAWLSSHVPPSIDPEMPAVHAIDRIEDVGPWYLLDGKKVFNNKANLAATPLVGINVDEKGQTVNAGYSWTGTAVGGTLEHDCSNWSTASGQGNEKGMVGVVGATDGTWTEFEIMACDLHHHLICIEQ